jgi:lysophospholipase L1-like esterase
MVLQNVVFSEPFRSNDRVVFIGDSITFAGTYHSCIQVFYATRFPERNVFCYNAGIGGDTASGAARRSSVSGKGAWQSDVRMYKPTAAVVMLGMNDVGRSFLDFKTKDELVANNAERLETYRRDYAVLLDHLEALGLKRILLIKSSPYDQTQVNPKAKTNLYKFGVGLNDALVALGKEVLEPEAIRRGYSLYDFNTPMLEINAEQQKSDPAFSIIGRDRVHPGADGNMIMAYSFLKSQNAESKIAELLFDVREKEMIHTCNCSASKLEISEDVIRFEYMAKSLPFPRSLYEKVSHLIPFEAEFNQEILRVQGLKDGCYTLCMDGVDVGRFPSESLAEGINLALLDKAPQVIQANQVLRLCNRRDGLVWKIRTLVWIVGYLEKISGHDTSDIEANKAEIKRIMADSEIDSGIKGKLVHYIDWSAQYEKLFEQLETMNSELYEAARPQRHVIKLSFDGKRQM